MDARVRTDLPSPDAHLRCRPPAPLTVVRQDLRGGERAPPAPWQERWRVLAVIAGALCIAVGSVALGAVWLSSGGLSPLEIGALALTFANLFWTTAAAITVAVGGVLLWRARTVPAPPQAAGARTALVFPVYNEDFAQVARNAEALLTDIATTRRGDAFEVFFLSDSTAPDSIALERRVMRQVMARRAGAPVFYRRRTANTERKSGNIAEFITRWGGRYDFMVVFDADSTMTAQALTTLVDRIAAAPNTAIIQTVPKIVNARSRYARLQQFALNTYGPLFGAGIAWWSGGGGNYWGHNAILRVRAFAAHAGLPILPGKAPFGGHILSHDFVEAALLRRAGWRVEMAPDIEGSFEQAPPTLIDAAARDRRWAQGNLQHLTLLFAPGFDLASRIHFFCGIMGYLSSVFWFGLLGIGLALALNPAHVAPIESSAGLTLAAIVLVTLMLPKLVAVSLRFAGRLPGAIGGGRFLANVACETIVTASIAPIMMINQTAAVVAALLGRDIGWREQVRDRAERDLGEAMRWFAPHKGAALLLLAMVLPQSLAAGIWAAPTALSLAASAFISHALAGQSERPGWLWRTAT